MKRTDAAWAAGFVDGEGCVRFHGYPNKNGKRYYGLELSIMNTDLRMLDKFQQLFGGRLIDATKKTSTRPAWRLVLYGKTAEKALSKMIPFLVGKREQAELALLARSKTRRGCRSALPPIMSSVSAELSRLKKQPAAPIDSHVLKLVHGIHG